MVSVPSDAQHAQVGETIRSLRDRLRDAEGGSRPTAGDARSVPFGLPDIDAALPDGGLRSGALHELLASGVSGAGAPGSADAPVALLAHLASCAHQPAAARAIAWIGPNVFPSVWTLRAVRADLSAHLLIDARRADDRLWASDLALRSAAISCVIADGSSFDSAATRRLQLAAESTGALCLLARPGRERAELSTAATRWLIEPAVSPHHSCARWTVRLLRCKGLRPTTHLNAWTVDIPHAPRDGRVSSILRDGPALARTAPIEPERRDLPERTLRFG